MYSILIELYDYGGFIRVCANCIKGKYIKHIKHSNNIIKGYLWLKLGVNNGEVTCLPSKSHDHSRDIYPSYKQYKGIAHAFTKIYQ